MLEDKTTNNVITRYHRIITGDPSQIEMGIIPEGKITITENGADIDVAQYALADVSAGITPTGTKNITANGNNIDVTNYAAVNVNVPITSGTVNLSIVNNANELPVCIDVMGGGVTTMNVVAVQITNNTAALPFYKNEGGCNVLGSSSQNILYKNELLFFVGVGDVNQGNTVDITLTGNGLVGTQILSLGKTRKFRYNLQHQAVKNAFLVQAWIKDDIGDLTLTINTANATN